MYSINVNCVIIIYENTRYHLLTANLCIILLEEEDEAEEDRTLRRSGHWPQALQPASGQVLGPGTKPEEQASQELGIT